ncbi:FAD-dependent oxidoreductase [Nocardioides insulae]|uniref:FAD-dependent oxidoreductase n=1 Tax=Nocardioides insulae TaxID=394734 RepID=UPI0004079ACA|nr:FAD-dependent oxidoreductase [Nocardioides insulae]
MRTTTPLVRILGAGIIGLSCAEELSRRGYDVEVVDPAPGSGASYAAAGMLSPHAEVWHGEPEILGLGRRSLALWPAYAGRLGVSLHTAGTVLAGLDSGDLQEIERQFALADGSGRARPLDRRELRDLEPGLGERLAGGVLLPEDWSVDPRALLRALLARTTVRARPSGRAAATTVLATGARLPAEAGGLVESVRGVRGEILRVRSTDPPLHTVRGWVRGEQVYLVPRADGEVVVGATTEEHEAPAAVTAGGVLRLLAAARELWPALERAEFVEATARDRPGTPDNLPLVGPAGTPGVVLAAGHFRHGVLLAPLTAVLVADHLDHDHVEAALDPRRFSVRISEGDTP